MPATVTIIERNGSYPGSITENIKSIDWKNLDDATTPYTSYKSAISIGSNSFTKYDYIRFSGAFTTLGNVAITYFSGLLPKGIKLMTSPSISLDSAKLQYSTPLNTIDQTITSNNFNTGCSVKLLVGPAGSASDPAYAPGKLLIANNISGFLYTNYFVSQLQTSLNATTGIIGPISLQISYDEV